MEFSLTSFGILLHECLGRVLYTRGWQLFMVLAQGWSLCDQSHCISTYIWLSGGSKHRHFSRYYRFLLESLWPKSEALWMALYRWLDRFLPEDPNGRLRLLLDDTTHKKSGKQIEGCANYSNRAGSARQEYRVIWGLNFVYLCLRVYWRGHWLSLPIGLAVYLKPPQAEELERSYQSRSRLARQMLDRLLKAMPQRRFELVFDGGYATGEMLKDLDPRVRVVGRMLVSAAIYQLPGPRPPHKRGAPPQKGSKLPPPKSWPQNYQDWQPHPTEKGVFIRTEILRWPKVCPRQNIRVVVIWRPQLSERKNPRDQKRSLEAFFTNDPQYAPLDILEAYQDRWAVEIDIRDAYAHYGLGLDRCRNLMAIEAINQMRMILATLRSAWFMITFEQQTLDLIAFRPWYRKKRQISQNDIAIALKETLAKEKISPIPRFLIPMAKIRKTWKRRQRDAA